MPRSPQPELYVVDGSNIATEGRSTPSLEQLNDAVLAFMETRPNAKVTVVVDATFGHRIAKKEVKGFDEAVANNELVTPPAGAVGRGDAFVLAIADRAGAGVLSNDSFQEFHGEYEWLFDDGRLIGGKPVPHVGWVFVERTPVRGPKSRQAVREANDDGSSARSSKDRANRRVRKKAGDADAATTDEPAASTDEPAASTDEPAAGEPAKAPSRRGRRGRGGRSKASEQLGPEQQATIEAAKAATAPKEHVNDLMPFLEFVEHHPVGTSCTAVVDSYSSHGAYARVDDVLVYIPLRLMDDPAPRSARSVLSMGEAVTAVIVGYVPDRRSIDAALPHMAGDVAVEPVPEPTEADDGSTDGATTDSSDQSEAGSPKKTAAKKTAANQTPAKKTPAKKTAAKKTAAKKTAAKKTAAKKTPAKKAAAKTTAAEKPPAEKAPARKTAAKKTAAKKTAAKKTAARKTAAKKNAAKKTAAKKAPAKKAAPARKRAAKRASTTTRSSGPSDD